MCHDFLREPLLAAVLKADWGEGTATLEAWRFARWLLQFPKAKVMVTWT